MRRWILVLLILLLPLRGWIGDAMATQMALGGHHAPVADTVVQVDTVTAPEPVHTSPAAPVASDDCDGHAVAPGASHGTMDTSHCETCATCQTCHTVAVLQPNNWFVLAPLYPPRPPVAVRTYVSADRALFLKPPIS